VKFPFFGVSVTVPWPMLRFSPYVSLKLSPASITSSPNFRLISSDGISREYPVYCLDAITPTSLEASAGLISKVAFADTSLSNSVLLAVGVTVSVAVPAFILFVNV